jgi:hypothetical protein
MIEEFEYKGVWWLPDKPNEKVSGTLRFIPNEGAILDLIGSFRIIEKIKKMLNHEIILGVSSNGKNITLYKCFEKNVSFNFPGFRTSSFYANIVFIGAHFQKPEEIKFKGMSVRYLHLDEWVNISGFEKKLPSKEFIIIKYKFLEPIQAKIYNWLKISINFKVTWSLGSLLEKGTTIKQQTEIQIVTSEDMSYEDYRKIIYHIQNFLSLGTSASVYPLAIVGFTEVNKEIIRNLTRYPSVEVFYNFSGFPKKHNTLFPFEMLFTFKDIYNRFDYFLRNWFEKMNLLEPVFDLYFETLYNTNMYLENRFLNLIQALESYHQRTFGGKYLSDKDYEVVYNSIIKAIPKNVKKDLKDRLTEYLKYGNEFSLRKRLKDIFDKYQEIISKYIKDKNNFIEKVVNTRNYYTHYNKKLKEHAAKEEDLHDITKKLKMCLEICLLTELGFSLQEIKKLFSRNNRY